MGQNTHLDSNDQSDLVLRFKVSNHHDVSPSIRKEVKRIRTNDVKLFFSFAVEFVKKFVVFQFTRISVRKR